MAFRFYGEVARLFVGNSGCFIRLQNVTPEGAELPKDGYFLLPLSHDNYSALYSLALFASAGRHRLSIRSVTDADSASHAEISYLVLDWPL
jgi:hypothetical protein